MTGAQGPAGGGRPDDGPRDPARGTPEERLRALGADGVGRPPAQAGAGHVPETADTAGTTGTTGTAAEARIAAELASLPSPPLPAHVLAGIDRALAAERVRARRTAPGGARTPGAPRGLPRRRVLVPAVVAVVLLVVVVLGVALRPGGGSPAPTAAPPPGPPSGVPSLPEPVVAAPGPALGRVDLPRALRTGLGATDAGPLTDPRRLAACLRAQPVPAAPPVLGARRVVLDGTPGVLLVLPTGVAARFRLLVVGEGCGADGPATLADTLVGR